jgi:undecaprenyl-diphosphatase
VPGRIRTPYTRAVLLLAVLLGAGFAVVAAVVNLRQGHPYGFDTGPHHWAVTHRPHGWVVAARGVTHAGTGAYPYLAAAAGGLLAGRRAGWLRTGVPTALLAVLALLAEQVVRTALMAAFARPRPPAADWATPVTGHAFPSGHSSSSAMAAGLLAWGLLRALPPLAGRLAAAVCVLAAAAIGFTRVYLGVHWPSDVLGGWLYAGLCLTLALPLLGAFVRRAGTADTAGAADGSGAAEPPVRR